MTQLDEQARLTLVTDDNSREEIARQVADRLVRAGLVNPKDKSKPSVRAFVDWARQSPLHKVDRETVTKVLRGDPTTTRTVIHRVTAALDDLEEELGMHDPVPGEPATPPAAHTGGTIKVHVKGPTSSWEVTYEGGPEDLALMNQAALDLVRKTNPDVPATDLTVDEDDD